MAAPDLAPFPVASSRVPDAETQARAFLTRRPEADGRGIVIAVMDTGCDPGAPGLQVTATGQPKIIDCVDCTGSGDVDTSTVVEAEADGTLQSPLSGRKLTLGSGAAWENPTKKWRVGMKRIYEVFDEDLVKRMQQERRAAWDELHAGYLAAARRELAALPKEEGEEAKNRRKDLEERVAQLAALQQGYEDVGTVVDVVAWHDGSNWRAALGLQGDGDLSKSPAMASFAVERQWASLGEAEQMNYCLNIYDEGATVSIVCDISSHGTHVAGIAAACHPERPELNGVAPGAQVVSLKIGDTRLNGMETGMALTRAFAYCVKHKVDLVNLSFGEGSSPACVGRVIDIARRAVAQHGVILVTSAGNSGPALSTVGSPGNGSEMFVTVGAHVSPPAMEAQYSMLEKVAAKPYTWSSRGPAQDGGIGVTICAPGSAITSIPNWTLAGAQLMNGTSMASPNACGCLALVLSGLKAQGLAWSPASVRRAAKASALGLPSADPFAVGAGMVQVDACFEYLTANAELPYRDVTIAAAVVTAAGRGRGLYLREPHEVAAPRTFAVVVEPCFKELDPSLNRAKIDLVLDLSIVSTAPWIQVPPYLVLPSGGANFNISVDPTHIPPGEAAVAYVRGFDSARPELGAIFSVPVTVVRPETATFCAAMQAAPIFKRKGIRLAPGTIERLFVEVPAGATWAEFTVTTKPFDGAARMLILHCLQMLDHTPTSQSDEKWVLRYPVAGSQKQSCRVEAQGNLEVCLTQNWSSLGPTEADIEVAFHGVLPEASTVTLSNSNPVARVNTLTGPGAEDVKPTASLSTHRVSLAPTSSTIRPGGERDLYFEGKQVYELVLEYAFKMEEDGEATPQTLLLNNKLYDSVFEAQLVMIYDASKRLIGSTDAWPKGVKLQKGDHVARVLIRHDDVSLLERLKGMPMALDRPLAKPVPVKAHASFNGAITGKDEFGTKKVRRGARTPVFFAVGVDEKLPDGARPGDLLLGAAGFGEPTLKPAGKFSRGGFTVQYAVAAPRVEEKKDESKPEDTRTNAEKLAQAVRDAQCKHLEGLRKWATKDEHAALLKELVEAHPKHLPLRQESLKAAEELKNPDAAKAKEEEPARLQRIVDEADKVAEAVDVAAVRAHVGCRVDPDDAEAVAKGKEMDQARDAVVDALKSKVLSLAKLVIAGQSDKEKLVSAFKALRSWVDTSDAKYSAASAAYEKACGRLGLALAALVKQIGLDAPAKKELVEEKAELLEALGWKAWAEHERKRLLVRYPPHYQPF